MALARGRFGIEYNPNRRRNDPSPLGWFVAVILAIAAVSFCCAKAVAFFRRTSEKSDAALAVAETAAETPALPAAPPPAAIQEPPPEPLPGAESWAASDMASRPVRVRNLLLRLDEAEKHGRLEMAVSTIEDLRALPGAFDLDARLVRRLGDLNVKWLFERANARWVADVKVKKGDSASRIAFEHGSTLSSLVMLNDGVDVSALKPGMTLKVMNHPRLSLAVNIPGASADLNLNGRFFRRYALSGRPSAAKAGISKVEKDAKSLFAKLGIPFSAKDRIELDALLPRGSIVTVLAPEAETPNDK